MPRTATSAGSPSNRPGGAPLSPGRRLQAVGDLGSFRREASRNFFRGAAAWSPDGRWIAVAEPQTVAFYRVVGPREVIRWSIAAAQIAWQP